MKDPQKILLNASADSSVMYLLDSYSSIDVENDNDALLFLGVLTNETSIKEKVEELVIQYQIESIYQEIQDDFMIFKTVDDSLFTEGLVDEQIQEQYFRFHSRISASSSLLQFNSILVDRIVELGKKLHLYHGMTNEAERCFQLILDENNVHAEVLYSMGRLQELKANMELAYQMYQQAVKVETDHVYANLQLGILCYTYKKDYLLAIDILNKVIQLEPFRIETYPHLAKAYLSSNEVERSIQVVESGLAIHPHDERALEVLGLIYWQHKSDIDKAKSVFETGLDHPVHGDSPLLLFRLGELYLQEFNDVDMAIVYFEKAHEGRPADKQILNAMIEVYLNHKQNTHRVDELYKKYVSKHDDIQITLQYAHFSKSYFGDLNKALKLVEKVLSIDPNVKDALILLKELKEEQDYQEILGLFDEDVSDDDEFIGGDALGDND